MKCAEYWGCGYFLFKGLESIFCIRLLHERNMLRKLCERLRNPSAVLDRSPVVVDKAKEGLCVLFRGGCRPDFYGFGFMRVNGHTGRLNYKPGVFAVPILCLVEVHRFRKIALLESLVS